MITRHSRLAAAVALNVTAGIGLIGSSIPVAADLPFVSALCPAGIFGGPQAINSNGSSFENAVVQAEIPAYAAACGPVGGAVSYTPTGSGTCVAEMKQANPGVAFCGSDIPYADSDYAAMTAAHGPLQTVPIFLSAVAVAYNEPCAGPSLQISGSQLSQIYRGGLITDWHEITSACPAGTPIVPLTYATGNGENAAFKAYLFKSAPTVGWSIPPDPSPFGAGTCPGSSTRITTDAQMAACIATTPNSIGYLDYADTSGMRVAALTNGAGIFQRPGPDPLTGVRGCTEAALAGDAPLLTFADWSHVDLTDGPVGYPICLYSYQLAFQLAAAPVFGYESAEQAWETGAFISWETSSDGQARLGWGYDPLPTHVELFAQIGAALLIPN